MVRFAPYKRFSWPLRWALRILTTLLVLVLVAAGGIVWVVRASFPQTGGELRLPGLTKAVTVRRDGFGVPQIYADTAADLFRAQGYVHAQDRFWEMDFRRKTTAGRLSELFGGSTLEIDKVVRTLGWRRVAEQELNLLTPEAKAGLDAYAAGVNAWMKDNAGFTSRSLEYAVLKLTNGAYEPEPWTPADSLAWLKAMAWDLRSNMDDEIERAVDAATLPRERVEELFPPYPYDRHRPIVGEGGVRDGAFTSGDRETTTAAADALRRVSATLNAVPSLLGSGGDPKGIGSNSWVVSGKHTDTGKPLLANDPHLGPKMPSIWYQAGLHCRTLSAECPYDVSGFTFSGLPGVVIGHNRTIAWGFTNLAPDVADLYLERVRENTYEISGTWAPLETRTERIEVAGGQPVDLTVRTTRHGPIVSDVFGPVAPLKTQGVEVALRWTALDPGNTGNAIFMLGRATDWDEFRKAAAQFEVPSQNLVYADTSGNIGYQAPGKIPVRSGGDGKWPAEGWTGEQEWTGFIPFDELPTAFNPDEGFIATANNAVVGPGYSHFLTDDWAYGYRSQRIADRITQAVSAGKVTKDVMSAIHQDSFNGLAPILVPHLRRVGGADTALFAGWDFTQGKDSAPAAYFNAVWRHLLTLTFDDELTEDLRPGGNDRWWEVVRRLLDDPSDTWWDDVKTPAAEQRDDILRAALAAASTELRGTLGDDPKAWTWGDLHTLELVNETFGTSGIGPIEWLFNRGPYRLSGGKDAVDATGWDAASGNYEVNWVPSMRMVVDLADLDASTWVNLTGASGHAFNGNYADQADLWAEGRTTPWPFTEEAVGRATADELTLTP
ncbi:penicillin acylase family protein [Herbidospora sp. NBRC 101105]|uniref:penicillin acylase family protein n=1 Tax=Herbidospora sp. NBRC 101105 TaxID=3032195 RepID=UPI0024A319B3|nr:penicillin acylase family protein [Herbidospora sp. NBRC 101105]GLX92448.1 penicillin amidase [Herbidospora sp. NBRC 101105]